MTDLIHDDVRRDVAEAYGRAVTHPSEGGCCGGPAQKGVVVKLAGYDQRDLASLPAEAVVNSFGCGNPTAFVDVKPGDTVLDLGCGAGIDILLAAKRVGPNGRAIGIDMTDEMIAKAKENIAAAGLTNVEVRKGIIESMPVETASVDWVISNCVINLSPDKASVFAEIARVLKPGGRMLVADIVVEELPESIRQSKALRSACVSGAISEKEYIDGLRAAGLVNIQVRERLVYDPTQLKGFLESELKEADTPSSDRFGCLCGESLEGHAESLAGKVWHAMFHAAKAR